MEHYIYREHLPLQSSLNALGVQGGIVVLSCFPTLTISDKDIFTRILKGIRHFVFVYLSSTCSFVLKYATYL